MSNKKLIRSQIYFYLNVPSPQESIILHVSPRVASAPNQMSRLLAIAQESYRFTVPDTTVIFVPNYNVPNYNVLNYSNFCHRL